MKGSSHRQSCDSRRVPLSGRHPHLVGVVDVGSGVDEQPHDLVVAVARGHDERSLAVRTLWYQAEDGTRIRVYI